MRAFIAFLSSLADMLVPIPHPNPMVLGLHGGADAVAMLSPMLLSCTPFGGHPRAIRSGCKYVQVASVLPEPDAVHNLRDLYRRCVDTATGRVSLRLLELPVTCLS